MKTRLGWVVCEQRWLIISYQFKVFRQTGRCMDMCMCVYQEEGLGRRKAQYYEPVSFSNKVTQFKRVCRKSFL